MLSTKYVLPKTPKTTPEQQGQYKMFDNLNSYEAEL